jgi:hypothetical protein
MENIVTTIRRGRGVFLQEPHRLPETNMEIAVQLYCIDRIIITGLCPPLIVKQMVQPYNANISKIARKIVDTYCYYGKGKLGFVDVRDNIKQNYT